MPCRPAYKFVPNPTHVLLVRGSRQAAAGSCARMHPALDALNGLSFGSSDSPPRHVVHEEHGGNSEMPCEALQCCQATTQASPVSSYIVLYYLRVSHAQGVSC